MVGFKFALTPLALIDLLVILPTYVSFAFPTDHQLLRSLRILWTFRLLKLRRYSESLQTIEDVIRAQQRELAMSFTAIVFFMVLSSTVVYFLEHDAQPQRFPDIPATMWWAVLTMTTIGDNFYPITPLGKLVGGLDNNIRCGHLRPAYVDSHFRLRGRVGETTEGKRRPRTSAPRRRALKECSVDRIILMNAI